MFYQYFRVPSKKTQNKSRKKHTDQFLDVANCTLPMRRANLERTGKCVTQKLPHAAYKYVTQICNPNCDPKIGIAPRTCDPKSLRDAQNHVFCRCHIFGSRLGHVWVTCWVTCWVTPAQRCLRGLISRRPGPLNTMKRTRSANKVATHQPTSSFIFHF